MKTAFPIFFVALAALSLYSCDRCDGLECSADDFYGQFRIVRAADGTDLVFGANKIYDKSQIKFYSLKGTDSVFFDYKTIKVPGTGYDSILYVNFFPRTDIAYMRLSNGDIDTFNISFTTTEAGKCCGATTAITKFRLNNITDIPGNNGTQSIRK